MTTSSGHVNARRGHHRPNEQEHERQPVTEPNKLSVPNALRKTLHTYTPVITTSATTAQIMMTSRAASACTVNVFRLFFAARRRFSPHDEQIHAVADPTTRTSTAARKADSKKLSMGPRRGRFSSIGASYQTLPPPKRRYTARSSIYGARCPKDRTRAQCLSREDTA